MVQSVKDGFDFDLGRDLGLVRLSPISGSMLSVESA